MASEFDPKLLNLPARWTQVIDLLTRVGLTDPLRPLAESLSPASAAPAPTRERGAEPARADTHSTRHAKCASGVQQAEDRGDQQENPPVGHLLDHLRNQGIETKKVPFALESVGLSTDDAELWEVNGVLFREDNKYWIPEIFRHGLGFEASGRPRVLAVANLVRRRNDPST
jgi:hypothetical protein